MRLTAASRSSKASITRPGVAVERERELRHVVGADREAVEVLEELVGEDGVGRDLAHHHDAQPVLAALEAVLPAGSRAPARPPSRVRTNGIMSSTLVRPISSRTLLHRLALELEAVAERLRDVARGAAEARASGSPRWARTCAPPMRLRVLVRLEVRQPHDHLLRARRPRRWSPRPRRSSPRRSARGSRSRATGFATCALRSGASVSNSRQALGWMPMVLRDDEFQPREAHARRSAAGRSRRRAAGCRRSSRSSPGSRGIWSSCDLDRLEVHLAGVDVAGVALGAGDRHRGAVARAVSVASSQPTTAGHAQLARDDRRVARCGRRGW